MKRHLTFIILLVCAVTTAQNIDEVLRYSTENLQGTARFQSMGGAFGALGGDLSALGANPASSAVFNNSQFTFSGTNYSKHSLVNYLGTETVNSSNSLNINQAGGVLVFKNAGQDSNWGKFALAANYDVVQNFNNQLSIQGNGDQGINFYFLNFAQGVPTGDISIQEGEFIEDAYLDIGANAGFADQQAFLGYYGGIIAPVDIQDDNTLYKSNAEYSNLNQNLVRNTSGHNSKFTLNVASQYQERFHIGASINFHNVLYNKYDEYTESNYDDDSQIKRTTFDNLLRTRGSGFSFGVGAIAKLNDMVRIGGSYQSPTWYRLEDNLSQRISSNLANESINFINFGLVNIFPTYTIKTPAKLTGSMALVFGKTGLLSIDYSYQDMSRAELRPANDPDFAIVNNEISNTLGAVSSIRIGGEYRIKRFSLRGGYRYEQSPYATGNTFGDLNGISTGLGYDFGGSRLDFAINRTEQDTAQRLFDAGPITPATINGVRTNATLSYTINF